MKAVVPIIFVLLSWGIHYVVNARAINLLIPDESKTKLVADPQGMEFLRNITSPVAIVSFIGRARTGKSFGLNYLLNVPHANGFTIGHTYNPETSGMQLWSEPFPNTGPGTKNPTIVLVADTEGLDSGPTSYETALLLMAAVVSSRLAYHVTEYVYIDDVMRLHGLACLVEHFDKRGVLENAVLPHISWIVHKSDLLKSPGQSDVDVLLNTWLAERPNPDGANSIAVFNSTVRIVRDMFTDHRVYLMPSAAPPGIACTDLEQLAYKSLAEGYHLMMDVLQRDLCTEQSRATCVHDMQPHMTGNDIANLIEMILPSANDGVADVGDRVADAIVRRHVTDIKIRLASAIDMLVLPLEHGALDAALDGLEQDALSQLHHNMKSTMPSALSYLLAQYEHDLREKFVDERRRAQMNNEFASDRVCSDAEYTVALGLVRNEVTRNGTVPLTVGRFDVAAEIARRTYLKRAQGPLKQMYLNILELKIQTTREVIVAETAPMRRISWAFGSMMIIIVLQLVRAVLSLVKCKVTFVVQAACLLAQFVGAFVCIIAVWSYFGDPFVKLELVIDVMESAKTWMELNSLGVCIAGSIGSIFGLLLYMNR